MSKLVNLIAGGVAGTLARYFLAGAVHRFLGPGFPYGTLVVNLTGCFIIGFLMSISENKFVLNTDAKLLLMVGFCGAFTTFSTFIMETNSLIKDGETLRALANVLASVVAGFLIFRVGSFIGEMI